MAHSGNSVCSAPISAHAGVPLRRSGAAAPGSYRSDRWSRPAGRRTHRHSAVAVQPVTFCQPVAPLLRLLQAANEEVDVDGFIFIKRPRREHGSGTLASRRLALTIYPDGQRYQWFHRGWLCLPYGQPRRKRPRDDGAVMISRALWLTLNVHSYLLFCRFQEMARRLPHSARRNHLRMPLSVSAQNQIA